MLVYHTTHAYAHFFPHIILVDAVVDNAEATNPDDDTSKNKLSKPKKSKNALKRIKWVKRHRKKTLSRRKRRANRELANSRPQRDAQTHVNEALDYLNTWFTSPEIWKFKKVPQLTLIKHGFNPNLVSTLLL